MINIVWNALMEYVIFVIKEDNSKIIIVLLNAEMEYLLMKIVMMVILIMEMDVQRIAKLKMIGYA